MKPIFSLFILFVCGQLLAQETKQVFMSCDVLGKKNEDVRYYHPIEGEYQIKLKNHYLPTKKELKALPGFVLINPQDYLKDSITILQANALRHQIDLDELIYVNWGIGVDSMNNQKKLDSFSNSACYVRDEKYSDVVQDYFNPFLISRFEITNAEYREFVGYVLDSLRRDMIYWHGINNPDEFFTDKEMAKMLKHDDQYYDPVNDIWQDFDPSNKFINRGLFSLNFDYDYWKEIPHERIFPIIESLTLRPSERWYKRRQINTKKLIYRYYTIEEQIDSIDHKVRTQFKNARYIVEHSVPIYPDTASWIKMKDLPRTPHLANLYFWHPSYENFPVVGLSYEQIKAFIHWKQKKMEKEFPELMSRYQLGLPNLKEIEWAINSTAQQHSGAVLGDEHIITDLLFGMENDGYGKYYELHKRGLVNYTQVAFYPKSSQSKKIKEIAYPELNEYDIANFVDLMIARSEQNSLKNRIEFLSNNVSEWMDMDYQDYEKLLDAYINYNCFADIDYCQYQRPLDANKIAKNDKDGKLIMGSNWYDERYENTLGVNTGGIYPKRFADKDSSFATVGFRLVLRLRD
ncbi:MAG: hypothetical protein ABJG68_00570 [Crocinitomicaceae bacterium]